MEQIQRKVGLKTLDLTGGESVYCINQGQMAQARKIVEENPQRNAVFSDLLESIEASLDRNERAALAFVLIDRLNNSRG